VGQSGRVFTVHKFRSMRQDAEAGTGAVWAQAKDLRIT
jgi:lipopolysaccharide/colanic/teichoic acid biosynthesis glycosyltransferase